MSFEYQEYNREERHLCTHLYRLLLEPIDSFKAIQLFTQHKKVHPFQVYSEVALIRDAYYIRKNNNSINDFLDDITRLIALQENVQQYRKYSDLPGKLKDPWLTHPNQIKFKAGGELTEDEQKIYGSLQGMFNAKPDLLICLPNVMLIYEAKFTLGFDDDQMNRTKNIVQIWKEQLYKDLKYTESPEAKVLKLGLQKFKPDVSWENVFEIANQIYERNDLSVITFGAAIKNHR